MWASLLKHIGSYICRKNWKSVCFSYIFTLMSLHWEMAEWPEHNNPASLKNFIFFLVCLQSQFLILLSFVFRTILIQSYNDDVLPSSSFYAGKLQILLISNSMPGLHGTHFSRALRGLTCFPRPWIIKGQMVGWVAVPTFKFSVRTSSNIANVQRIRGIVSTLPLST